MSHTTSRDMFRSGIGAFAATLGSAIGLGNIWKFPFLTGMNGGSAFVFAYLLSVLLVGLPILVTEHVIGRRMRMNAVPAYAAAGRARIWSTIGYAGLIAAVLIMAFYTDIAGWVFAYVFKSLNAAASSRVLGPEDFQALAGGTLEPLAWQTMVLVLVVIIVGAGVSRGIERATKTLMPLLLVLLLVCDIRALTLPNSYAGVQFLFAPNPGRLSPAVLLSALGLAFFKLSLGMGTMTTYGSYLPDSTKILPNATRVALADTLVSLLAGLAIFPAVFSFGVEPNAGPGLLFITIPLIFSRLPLGWLFTAMFFILAAIATIGAMVSLIEVPTAFLAEKGGMSRFKAAVLSAAAMLVLGVFATLSMSPRYPGLKLFGLSMFDLFDFISSNILLPLGGIAIAVVGGWILSRDQYLGELGKNYLRQPGTHAALHAMVRWVAPVLITLILLNGLGVIRL